MKDSKLFRLSPLIWKSIYDRKSFEQDLALYDKSPYHYRYKICLQKSYHSFYDSGCLGCTNRNANECYKFIQA